MVRSPLPGCAGIACALLLSFALYATSFEPFNTAEFAYIFAVPAILCARLLKDRDNARTGGIRLLVWRICSVLFSVLAWMSILVWMRHVWPPAGYAALLFLSVTVSFFIFPWYWLFPNMLPNLDEAFGTRLFKLCAVAALWVCLEWIRSKIFTGFPWLLLAHSQWTRPAVIQTAAVGGVWMVSFTLVFFNLATADYLYRLYEYHALRIRSGRAKTPKISRFCPEFYVALVAALASMWMYARNMPRTENEIKAFRAGLVQTNFAGILKWDGQLAAENLGVVERLTTAAAKNGGADVVLLPEAATPPRWPIIGNEPVRMRMEKLARDNDVSILTGNMAYLPRENLLQNGAFAISPRNGLQKRYYAKRKLVPFGEYIPAWASFFASKTVPVGGIKRGDGFKSLDLDVNGRNYKVGAMICYEDIFPCFGREAALNGADLLYVCTNDSWYGREGGAWQHAAHSAFQAVSTRLPLLRSSNNGLSAVFDQYGRMRPCTTVFGKDGKAWNASTAELPPKQLEIRDADGNLLDALSLRPRRPSPMLDENGSIYFRGAAFSDVVYYKNLPMGNSFYVRHGDWFAWLCAATTLVFITVSGVRNKFGQKKA